MKSYPQIKGFPPIIQKFFVCFLQLSQNNLRNLWKNVWKSKAKYL
jgi:hypothetical protein